MDDQRVHQRLRTQVQVEINIDKDQADFNRDGFIGATTRDLSAGGIFIELAESHFAGQADFVIDDFLLLKHPILLKILLPVKSEPIKAKGKAVWIEKQLPGEDCQHGVAISFTEISAEDRKLIDNFILSRI